MSNPVVQAVHRGQGEFIAGALDAMGNALNTVGTASTVLGYGTSMIPGGQVVGGGLIGLGNTMSGASGMLSAGGDLMRGDVAGAAMNLTFVAAGRANNRIFGNLEGRGAMSSPDRQILQTGADLKISIASFIYNH
jgi:hypothetical protein